MVDFELARKHYEYAINTASIVAVSNDASVLR